MRNVIAMLMSCAAITASAAAPEVIYERATLSTGVHGSVGIDRRYEVTLQAPVEDCIDGPHTCRRDTRFRVVWRVGLERVVVSHSDLGTQRRNESTGNLWVAADLTKAEELEFDETLREMVGGLRGEAFEVPFAGIEVGTAPFDIWHLIGESTQDAWICQNQNDIERVHRLYATLAEDGSVSGYGTWIRDEDRPLCAEMQRAFAGTSASIWRMDTTLAVQRLHIAQVLFDQDWYPGLGDADALHPLPDGTLYEKRRRSSDDENERGRSKFSDGKRAFTRTTPDLHYAVEYSPADIAILRASSAIWVTRWQVEHVERQFGINVPDRRESLVDLWIAALPFENPLAPGQVPTPPNEGWLESIADTLVKLPTLEGEVLSNVVFEAIPYSAAEDWLVVICDGSDDAEYGFAAGFQRAAVTNSREFCDTLRRSHPSAP